LGLITGCSGKATQTATPASPALTPTASMYPGPLAKPQQNLPQVSYPYPGAEIVPFNPYPLPQEGEQPPVVYPGPGVYPPPAAGTVEPTMIEPATPTASATLPPTPTFTPRPTRDINQELHATDPSTVQLASGKIQLIEFFAYW
jgi:hypothetical protein